MKNAETVISIDPGRAKCGLAVVSGPQPIVCHTQSVVETSALVLEVAGVFRRFPTTVRLIVGNGTGSGPLRRALKESFPDLPLESVNETGSSERARERQARERPPRGWRRLLPVGLRGSDPPYDDYVAVILAEEYFARILEANPVIDAEPME